MSHYQTDQGQTDRERVARDLAAQDNRATAVPIFAVQQRIRDYGYDSDYCDDYLWLDGCNDSAEATPEEAERLDAGDTMGHDGWIKAYYRDRWEFVQPFLTESAAEAYIRANAHNLTDPRTYVYSGHRNPEWKFLREFLSRQGAEGREKGEAHRYRVHVVNNLAIMGGWHAALSVAVEGDPGLTWMGPTCDDRRHAEHQAEILRAALRAEPVVVEVREADLINPTYRRGYMDAWDLLHSTMACGHARANLRDSKWGTPEYSGEEECEVCAALRAEPQERDIRAAFIKVGWAYSHAIADGGVCSDGSCHRCRLARVLFEAEPLPSPLAAPPADDIARWDASVERIHAELAEEAPLPADTDGEERCPHNPPDEHCEHEDCGGDYCRLNHIDVNASLGHTGEGTNDG